MDALVIPLHLGALHPVETLAMGVLALGPFVILAVVVTIVSRRDRRAEARERADLESQGTGGDQATQDRSARWQAANSTTSDTAAPQSVQE
jgi:hypothetical protein